MNTTSRNVRLSAAFASVVITYALIAGIAGMAKPQVAGDVQMAQSAVTTVVR